jgi:23S rRNA G2445 N2-methylase RlmL
MTAFFAVTFRGFESVVAREIAALPGVHVTGSAYRRVYGTYEALDPLLKLRAADDVFVHVAAWTGIARSRDTLARITALSAALDLHAAARAVAAVRPIPPQPAYSVSASFVGKRNYRTDEIKRAAAEGITRSTGWLHVESDSEADLNVRLFIEGESAVVGVRVGASPLHYRAYKHALHSGTLKPPIAASLLLIAGVGAGSSVLDPFCGAGTILLEAAGMGASVRGGDFDAAALDTTRANAAVAGARIALTRWDARILPLRTGSVPTVVTNLPWGQQVEAGNDPGAFYHAVCTELERVLAENGTLVALTSVPELLIFRQVRLTDRIEISLFGQTPTVAVYRATP